MDDLTRTRVVLGSRNSVPDGSVLDLAGIVERLCDELPLVARSHVAGVVAECAEQVLAPHPGALPELVERLARQRLRGPRPLELHPA